MKIFLVSLKKDIAKRNNILQQAGKLGLEVEVTEAVYGKELTEKQLGEAVFDYKNCALSKGEIGCSLSHLNIYRRITRDNIPLALVLEDDAIMKNGLPSALEEIELFDKKSVPSVYMLSRATGYFPLKRRKLQKLTLFKLYRGYNTYGYVINNAAARKMLSALHPVVFEADMWEYFKLILNLDIYCLLDPVIEDGDKGKEYSIIEAERAALSARRPDYRGQMVLKKWPLAILKKGFYRTVCRLFSKRAPKA
jgi:glycosyl transferase family 25